MKIEPHMLPELGRISRHVEVPELIIRTVPSYSVVPELDGQDDDEPNVKYEDRLQGRLVNATRHCLSNIQYDVAFFDESGGFLGLNRSRITDENELEADDHLPIDMKVQMPDETAKCVFNVRAQKTGLLGKLLWG